MFNEYVKEVYGEEKCVLPDGVWELCAGNKENAANIKETESRVDLLSMFCEEFKYRLRDQGKMATMVWELSELRLNKLGKVMYRCVACGFEEYKRKLGIMESRLDMFADREELEKLNEDMLKLFNVVVDAYENGMNFVEGKDYKVLRAKPKKVKK